MSFGAEFRKMRESGGAPKATPEVVKESEEAAAAKAAELPTVDDPDAAIYSEAHVHGQTLGEATEAPEGEAPVVPEPPPAPKKVPVKLNGKTFDTVEEAMEYAAEVERALEKKEAFEKGLEAAKPQTPKPAEIKKITKIADKLFENPEQAFEELEAYFLERAEKRFEEKDQAKTQQQQAIETAKKTWDNFYQSNNDLADWQEEVQIVTSREWNRLQHMPAKEGLEEIAKLSRAYVASIKEKALPKQNLPSKSAQTAHQGGKSTTATVQSATKKELSFAEQVKSTNRRTAMQGES